MKPKPHSIHTRFVLMQAGAMTLALLILAAGLYLDLMVQGKLTRSLEGLARARTLNMQARSALDGTTESFWIAYYSVNRESDAFQRYQKASDLLLSLTARYDASTPAVGNNAIPALKRAVGELTAETRLLLANKTDAGTQSARLNHVEEVIAQIHRTLEDLDQPQIQALEISQAKLDNYTRLLSVMLILFALLAVLALIWFGREHETQIWMPLERLRQMVRQVGAGDLEVSANIPRSVELGSLIGGFLNMTDELREMRESLEEKVRERTASLEAAQMELVQSAKLASLGQLLAGVAHEINNPLTAVLGFAEMVLARTELEPSIRAHLQIVRSESLRLKKLVASLSSFARRAPHRSRRIDLRKVVEELSNLRQYELNADNITLHVQSAATPVWVLGDADQLLQVLLNLALNAEHAIKARRDAGDIWLECMVRKGSACISVKDNGAGMTAAVRERIFDPFFTTKPVGEGTGLGLSISYGIVQQHQGELTVDSHPGKGTSIEIRLPFAAEETAPTTISRPLLPLPASTPVKATGRILAIDDEPEILDLIQLALHRTGYEVSVLGVSARLEQFIQDREFDLVICDLKMPGRNGLQVLQFLREKRPALARRFLLMTGNMPDGEDDAGVLSTLPVLHKPFTLSHLREVVSGTMDARAIDGARRD